MKQLFRAKLPRGPDRLLTKLKPWVLLPALPKHVPGRPSSHSTTPRTWTPMESTMRASTHRHGLDQVCASTPPRENQKGQVPALPPVWQTMGPIRVGHIWFGANTMRNPWQRSLFQRTPSQTTPSQRIQAMRATNGPTMANNKSFMALHGHQILLGSDHMALKSCTFHTCGHRNPAAAKKIVHQGLLLQL